MNNLKQRIIGALVLISLAVIFLPIIFDKPHQQRESQILAIPLKPDTPVVVFKNPQAPQYKMLDKQGNEIKTTSRAPGESVVQIQVPATTSLIKAANNKQKEVAPTIAPKVHTLAKPSRITKPLYAAKPEVSNVALFKNSYMVQLATFARKKNAINLRSKLLDMKLDGHIQPYDNKGQAMWRVFAGPYTHEKKAKSIKSLLDKTFKLKTIIKYF